MDDPAEAAEQRDWQALPAGVLQHVFYHTSTWQIPGSCLGASVCRSWRSAAAGCRGMRLLYFSGYPPADQAFATWLLHNTPQLEALTIAGSSYARLFDSGCISAALVEAAGAALAAGRPLQLHTLRVLQGRVSVDTVIKCVARLPALRCLQLEINVPNNKYGQVTSGADAELVMEQLAALQHATQLQELYLTGPNDLSLSSSESQTGLLPPTLKRLSWDPSYNHARACSLAHMTQLTFLHLRSWPARLITSSALPSGLQQLQLGVLLQDGSEVLQQQGELVTGWSITRRLEGRDEQQLLTSLPNLESLSMTATALCSPGVPAALKQPSKITALKVDCVGGGPQVELRGLQVALTAAASMRNLRRLHLRLYTLPEHSQSAAPTVLTQLKQLRVSVPLLDSSNEQQWRLWAERLGGMSWLQSLSVPHVLLSAGQGWLRGLQQLRVLALHWAGERAAPHVRAMPWLEGCRWEALPPQLQVLGIGGVTAEQAAGWQLRRCLQQVVGSSGCEVVVGVDLDDVADPIQQMAGLPVALQQALMMMMMITFNG